MRKNFVLDTNVLLHDPQAMFQFADNVVIIPIYVLEEIDQFKKELSERGRSAREVCRRLDDFREHGHHLANGVDLPRGGTLRVALGGSEVPTAMRASQMVDNLIPFIKGEEEKSEREPMKIWGALEGSILFWAWVLTLLSALVVFWNREREGSLEIGRAHV